MSCRVVFNFWWLFCAAQKRFTPPSRCKPRPTGPMCSSATGGAPARSWPGESCREQRSPGGRRVGGQLWENGEEGEAAKSCRANGDSTPCTVDRPVPGAVTIPLALTDPFLTLLGDQCQLLVLSACAQTAGLELALIACSSASPCLRQCGETADEASPHGAVPSCHQPAEGAPAAPRLQRVHRRGEAGGREV